MVKVANYHSRFLPDHPYSTACGAGLQKYGDFDRGIANQTDGAYINKPDEGNTYTGLRVAQVGDNGIENYIDSAGQQFSLKSESIVSRGVATKSTMPDGLEATVSIADLRDLVTFLSMPSE